MIETLSQSWNNVVQNKYAKIDGSYHKLPWKNVVPI